MYEIHTDQNTLILTYNYSQRGSYNDDWVRNNLKEDNFVRFKSVFHFTNDDLLEKSSVITKETPESIFDLTDFPPVSFILGKKVGEYFKIEKRILDIAHNVYLHQSCEFALEMFIAEQRISVFKLISRLINQDIFVGVDQRTDNYNPVEEFYSLIKNFPTTYEKNLYAEARVSSILKNYFESTKDSESQFKKYLNKKPSIKGQNLSKTFSSYEVSKYETILDKLQKMLLDINNYNEKQWQTEILEIIVLLYPKYILAIDEVSITTEDHKKKRIDFLLLDFNGNVDIIEIKQPFENSIMTKSTYRGNFIPLRELSGTIMQLEKYLFHLKRSGKRGERAINEKYKDTIPDQLTIKFTNPQGIVIMGREHNLSEDQKRDFEVLKRKYKNIVDIITYDELIQRLKMTIGLIKKL